VAASLVRPHAAVAFYPGCVDEGQRGFRPSARLLMLLGSADEWTPAEPCEALAQASAPPRPEAVVYAGAYHGFDGTAAVQLRRDVPNGQRPGQGVHVGGDPAAREASRERLLRFAREAFERP
jgi:dienelactone hydrolase